MQVEDCSSAWKPGRGDKEAFCRGSTVDSLLGKKREKQPFPQTPCFPSKLPFQGPSLWKLCLVLLPSHAWEGEVMTSLETSYGVHMEVS